MSATPQTAASSGRKKAIGDRSLAIGDATKPPAALGHESQDTSSLERAKEGAWPVVPLSEVVGINPRPGSDELADDSLASFIPMRCVEEESGRFEPLGDRKVAEVRKGYTPFRDGDVIFAKVTPCMENEKAAVMKGLTNGIGFGSTEFFALRPADRLDANYLFHFVLQSSFRQQAARNMTGAVGLRRVPKSYLEQQPIPLAPLPEQRRIVAEIEKQFTRLEAGVAALRRVQANLKRYRAAVLKAACEGRLVPTEAELARVGRVPPRGVRPSAKNAASGDAAYNAAPYETGEQLLQRILAERRQNWQGRGQYKEPATPDTNNLAPLPEGYAWATFGQICRVQGGFAFKSSDYVKEGVPLVRISNLVNGRVQVSDDTVFLPPEFAAKIPDFLLRKGDVLIAMSGATTGKMATVGEVIPALLNQRVGRFVLSSSRLSSAKFVSYLVMQITEKVLKGAYGAAQPNISPSGIEEMPIPLPPLAEQTRIVAKAERRLSVVEELEAVVSANLQRATRLRQSILQRAFTGKLINRDW